MRTDFRSGAVLTGLTVALAAASLRCTLDFDRYNPPWVGADAQQDQSSVPPGSEAGGGPDADLDGGAPEAQGSCTTPQGCLSQASSCAMTCKTAYQHCLNGCRGGNGGSGCMMGCTSTEQSCGGTCITKCIACGNNASCSSSTLQGDCLQSGTP